MDPMRDYLYPNPNLEVSVASSGLARDPQMIRIMRHL